VKYLTRTGAIIGKLRQISVQKVWISVLHSGRRFSYPFLDKLAVPFKVICSEPMFRPRQHLAGRQAQIKGHIPFKYHLKGEASSRGRHHTKEVYVIDIYIYICTATVPQSTDIVRTQYTECRYASPPEVEQVMLETCIGL
jgi:hypothetical protein